MLIAIADLGINEICGIDNGIAVDPRNEVNDPLLRNWNGSGTTTGTGTDTGREYKVEIGQKKKNILGSLHQRACMTSLIVCLDYTAQKKELVGSYERRGNHA